MGHKITDITDFIKKSKDRLENKKNKISK